ncbi:vWA domain-containing protein [Vibrio sp. E150_011]
MFNSLDVTLLIKQFHFIRPEWLLLLPFIGVLFWVSWKNNRPKKACHSLPKHLEQALTINHSNWRAQLPLKVLALVMTLAVIICAGPTWQRQPSPLEQNKSALLIVLDSSQSMLNLDVAPTRLERSKHKIQDLIALRQGGKTGLIVYAGSSHLAMPLTEDPYVITPFLEAVSPDIMPIKGKRVSRSLPVITSQLQDLAVPTSVLLITDGIPAEETEQVLHYFTNSRHQLIMLSVNGNSDTHQLQSLASQTGAYLYQVTPDNSDVVAIADLIRLNTELNSDSTLPWQDNGYYLLFPLAFLYLLWFKRGWVVQWCILGLITTSLCFSPQASAQDGEPGNPASGETTQTGLARAVDFFVGLWITPDQLGQWYLMHDNPKLAALYFVSPKHKANAYFLAGDYKRAAEIWVAFDDVDCQFNLGLALIGQREYVAARKLYDTLHKQYPDDESIALNLKVVSDFIQFINDFSEGQGRSDEGQSETSFSLPADQPQTADGHDQEVMPDSKIQLQITADDLSTNPEMTKQWLLRVEANPALFLQRKFALQLRDNTL